MRKWACLWLAVLPLLAACGKTGEEPEVQPDPEPEKVTPEIKVSPESEAVFASGLSVEAEGGTSTLSFTATDNWSSSVTETKANPWITLEPASGGKGEVTVKVTLKPNTVTQERSATVKLTCGDVSKSFTVKQAAYVEPEPSVISVESVTLDKERVTLEEGQSIVLSATVSPADATDKSITWSSSNTAVASVDQDGKVSALKEGEAVVTAKAGEKSASCQVVVTKPVVEVTSVTLDKTELHLEKGASETLTATVSPADASDKSVAWSSSDADVATVDQEGKVTAVGGGNATITAKAGEKTATCTVTVTVPVESVSLDLTTASLKEGQSLVLTATVNPADAPDPTVTWSSSDAAVATVDQNGKVTAVKNGSADITAKAGDKSAVCKVTVSDQVVEVTSVTLNKTQLTLTKGASETLTATVSPADATDKSVTWSSSDSSVAKVDQSGQVTAVGGGNAIITAKAGEKTATCTVSVMAPVESISLNLASASLRQNEELQLVATVNPADATDKTVTWSSSDSAVATVDGSGKVKALKEGEARITASAGDQSATCVITVSNSAQGGNEGTGTEIWD